MKKDSEQLFARPLSSDAVTTPSSWDVPARAPLQGRHIRLEPLDPALHAAKLFQAGHGSKEALEVWENLPFGPAPDEATFAAFLQVAVKSDWVTFSLRPEGGKPAGMASYLDIQPASGVVEIGGIWFAPELQRTRAGTEALFLLLSHAMDHLHYRRIQWRTDARNEKSRRTARRLGFRFEGIFYNHMIVKGRNRDTAWYSILDHEWPEVREIVESWLDDGNFDPAGAARRSLTAMMKERRADERP